MPATSRMLRVMTNSEARPVTPSAKFGPSETTPRLGFRPTVPLNEDGIRIDPPASLAWATGTAPDATSAPLPPLDPPTERLRSHGLRVDPLTSGSVLPP